MLNRSWIRDVALLACAAGIGWWARGVNQPVLADSSAREDLGFQLGGTGIEGSLTLYSPATHTFYVYPTKTGNSHINCIYSLRVERPGGAIERENCPVGSTFSH